MWRGRRRKAAPLLHQATPKYAVPTIKHLLSAEGGVVREIYVEDRCADGLHDIIGENTVQDAEPVLARAQRLRDMHGGQGVAGMKLAGTYTMPFVDKLMRDGAWNDQDALRKLLNDPDLRAFRVWQGRV